MASQRGGEALREDGQTVAAGVHDAGLLEHRKEIGGAPDGLERLVTTASTTPVMSSPASTAAGAAARGVPQHGEHRSLDRLAHRLEGDLHGSGQRVRDGPPVDALAAAPSPSHRPRRIWLRMTPELPRAPMSDPWVIA